MKKMKEIETLLHKRKEEFNQIVVPIELEERLNNALKDKSIIKRKSNSWITKAVAACLVVVVIGYNFDTLAFYGKRLMGYDTIMNGTLRQLNELGKGQVIDKSYTFKNGAVVMLDGIMIDENQLLMFYSIKDPSSMIDSSAMPISLYMEGISKTYNMRSGQGEIDEVREEIRWISSFETPRFYERTLDLKVNLMVDGILEEGKITFKLDRNKAMGYTLKKTINQTLAGDQTKVKFETITASPTRTVISGSIQNTFELAKDQLSKERIRPQNVEVRLMADDEEIPMQGGGMSTNLNGIKFHKEFDALPAELHSLEIHLVSFSADHDVNERINIKQSDENQSITIQGQVIEINKIHKAEGSTFITITTDEDTTLSRVYLGVDTNKIELEETKESNLTKLEDGRVLHTRTLRFGEVGKNYELIIERMTYAEKYNKVIEIPIN